MMDGITMNIKLFIMLLTLVIYASFTSAAVSIGTPSPSSVIIKSPTVTTTGGGSNGSSNFTQADADALYWRLDASNDPPTSSWNMGSYGFLNLGNSTFIGADYLFNRRGVTELFWNATDGSKINFAYLDPNNNAFDFVVDVVIPSAFSLYAGDVQYGALGISKSGGSGDDFTITNSDPTTGGIVIEGGMLDIDSNNEYVQVGAGKNLLVNQNISASNVYASNICYGNGTNCNVFNSTYAQTSADVTANRSAWFSTYNATYDAKISYNSTFNQTLTDLLYLKVNATCIPSKEYIVYSDNAAPPNGFLPYGTSAVTGLNRGYPVLYPMEITAITLSASVNVQCVGADAGSASCRGAPTFNQSGLAVNPFNMTLNFQSQLTNTTSINLSLGDQILFRTFGNAISNGSSQGLTNVIVQFEAKRRC